MDNIHITGSKPIDSIVAIPYIMDSIEGYKLLEANKVLLIDHRLYLVNINLEQYFKRQLSL